MPPYRHFKETTPDERKRLGKEGGYTTKAIFRQFLLGCFNRIQIHEGIERAVYAIWRAGKRSGYDARYRDDKRQRQKIKRIKRKISTGSIFDDLFAPVGN